MACSLEAIERSRVDIPRREAKSGDRANPTRIYQPIVSFIKYILYSLPTVLL